MKEYELQEVHTALRTMSLYRKKQGYPENSMDRRIKKALEIIEAALSICE